MFFWILVHICIYFLIITFFGPTQCYFWFVTMTVYSDLPEGHLIIFVAQQLSSFLWLSSLIYKTFLFLQPPLEGRNEQKL